MIIKKKKKVSVRFFISFCRPSAAVLVLHGVTAQGLVHVVQGVCALDAQLGWVHHGNFTLDRIEPWLMFWRVLSLPGGVVLTRIIQTFHNLQNNRVRD